MSSDPCIVESRIVNRARQTDPVEDAKTRGTIHDSQFTNNESFLASSCPLPITNYKQIVLAHGSGGKLSHQLIQKMVLPQSRNELLEPLHDGAILSLNSERVAFTTDSVVVSTILPAVDDIAKFA